MERHHESVKYYPAYDMLVMSENSKLQVLYKSSMFVDKVSREYTLYGQIRTFEVLSQIS